MMTIKLPIILIMLLTVLSAQGVESKKKSLVLVGDLWCPYNCTQGDENEGFLVELARRALFIYGISVEYKNMPWNLAMSEVAAGKADGIVGVSNPTSKQLVTTQLPLEYSTSGAYTKEGTSWIYDGLNSLKGKRLGIILDYEIDESINQYIGSTYAGYPGLFSVEDGEDAVAKSIKNLLDERIDVYIEDQRVMKYYLHEMGAVKDIKSAGKISKQKLPIYIGFYPKLASVAKYVSNLEEGIASLKATGEYDELRKKYEMDAN